MLRFEIPQKEAFDSVVLNPEVRKELWLILKEASSNAIKHSGCNALNIVASFQGHILELTISDNGCGFDTTGSFKGKGLGTMRMRAKHLGGAFDIISNPGTGTTVTLTTKVN